MKKIVLYAEDEESDVFFMKRAFERAGLGDSLKVVTDGAAVISYLSGQGGYSDRTQNPLPCVVLLDLNMPFKNGFEVLQWIRSQTGFKHLPVLVFTSSAYHSDRIDSERYGATEFVVKPSLPTDLHELVDHLKRRWLPTCSTEGAKTNV